ncbi:GNAT family N-acetyltransferase [Leptothrix discophora]|uniref:GNAT family N-acetyltransferase n=2 Tax=Leptothrix discophora TaxID=89 RepID=A0ABT9G3V0_LEPDI|nr:GNAT family N-acetyltransferase [Leptothrix discophora]
MTRERHLLSRPEDLAPWADDWTRLARRHRSPTHGLTWAAATLATLVPRDGAPLQLFVVRRDGHVCALAPLQCKRDGWLRRLEMLGADDVGEPLDLMYEDDPALDELLRAVRAGGLPTVYARLPHDSAVPALLPRVLAGRRSRVRVRPAEPYPAIDLRLHPEGELNSGRRSDLRRMRRKAAEQGGWRHDYLKPAPHEVPALLAQAVEIEARSWKTDDGHALCQNEVERSFLLDQLTRCAQDGSLRIAFGHLGDRAVAMQLAQVDAGSYWLFKIGYDAGSGAIAPGQLLMQDTLAEAVAEGLHTYELMGTAADWTRVWTRQELASWRAEVLPLGGQALLRLGLAAWRRLRPAR